MPLKKLMGREWTEATNMERDAGSEVFWANLILGVLGFGIAVCGTKHRGW